MAPSGWRASSHRPQSVRLPQRDAYVVHGIPFEDEATAVLARKVLTITSFMSLFALVVAILSLVTGWWWGTFLWAGLILPLCGFCGTLNRSRFTVALFSSCCFIMAAVYTAAIVSTLSVVGDWVTCACDPQCRVAAQIPSGDAAKVCSNPGLYRALFYVSTGISVLMVLLMLAGGLLGCQLAGKPHFEDVVEHTPVMVPYTVVTGYAQQPQYYQPPPPPGTIYYSAPPPAAAVYSPHPVPAVYRAYASPQGGAQPQPQPPAYTYAAPVAAAATAPASPSKRGAS